MFSSAKSNLTDCSFAGFLHRPANDSECVHGFLGLRNDKIGLLKKTARQIAEVDKLADVDYVLTLDSDLGDLFRLNGEIFPFLVFVSLDDIGVVDWSILPNHIQMVNS